MNRFTTTRRAFLSSGMALAALPLLARAQTPTASPVAASPAGDLLVLDSDGALWQVDVATGKRLTPFAIPGKATDGWAATAPGTALVRTKTTLSIVSTVDGSAAQISLPDATVSSILPSSIQFRGTRGVNQMLIGTPQYGADTYLVDLTSGERSAVIGLLGAATAPTSLPNVAVAADDAHLLAWDGRTSWVVDIASRTSRVLGTTAFTFSAGFSPDGKQLVYSQQPTPGKTELRLQSASGASDELLFKSNHILVSLWFPYGDAMLLDERTDSGGELTIYHPATGLRGDLLSYTGATNIVQFSPDGQNALISIQAGVGSDWYLIDMSGSEPTAQLLTPLQDSAISPGFAFDSQWGVATVGVGSGVGGSVLGVDLATGDVHAYLSQLDSDANLSLPIVAPNGPGAIVTIDSFSEYAVHFLDFANRADRSVDLTKGGSALVAPDGSGFAVVHHADTDGSSTVVYDNLGNETRAIGAAALTWI